MYAVPALRASQPPPKQHRSRKVRRAALIVALLLAPLVLYLGLGNLFLNAGGVGLILGGTREITLKYRYAWTLWPGRVNLRDFHLTFQDANVEFALDLAHANVRIELTELPGRTFHATRLRGDGAAFRMRHRIQPDAVHAPWVRALAPIPEFSNPPLFEATVPTPPIPEGNYRLWTVHLEDVDVGISELWVQFIRYRGHARATGAFQLRPARSLWVGPAALDFNDGRVTLGEDQILGSLRGRMTCIAHPFDVRVPTGLAVLRHLSSRIELHGRQLQVDALPRWFSEHPEVALSSAPGALEVNLEVWHGRGQPGGRVAVQSDWVEAVIPRGTFRARGFKTTSQIVDDGGADTELRIDAGEFELKGATTRPIEVHDAALAARIERADSADPPTRAERRLSVEKVRIPDARWLNDALHLRGVRFLSGAIDGKAAFREHGSRFSGAATVGLHALRAQVGPARAHVDGGVELHLKDASTSHATGRAQLEAKLSRARVDLGEASVGAPPSAEANLDGLRIDAKLERRKPGELEATVRAEAASAKASAGELRFQAIPKLDLSALGEPLTHNLHAELTLADLRANSVSADSDCPSLRSPNVSVRLASSERDAEVVAKISGLNFAWGDFRARADSELEMLMRHPNEEERTLPTLSFALKNRTLSLASGRGAKSGWDATLPNLNVTGKLTLAEKNAGWVEVGLDRLQGRIGGSRIASRLRAHIKVAELDLTRKHSRFSADVELGPADVQTESERVSDWWARIALGSALVSAERNLDLSAMFRANLRDATPGLAVLAENGSVPDLIARNLKLEQLQVIGILQRRCRLTDFIITQASGGPISARGRLNSTTDSTRAALLLRVNGLEAISAGVALGPDGTGVTPLAGDDWLREEREKVEAAARKVLQGPCASPNGACGGDS